MSCRWNRNNIFFFLQLHLSVIFGVYPYSYPSHYTAPHTHVLIWWIRITHMHRWGTKTDVDTEICPLMHFSHTTYDDTLWSTVWLGKFMHGFIHPFTLSLLPPLMDWLSDTSPRSHMSPHTSLTGSHRTCKPKILAQASRLHKAQAPPYAVHAGVLVFCLCPLIAWVM